MKKPNEQMPRTFVAIDFETLKDNKVSACSIGMVRYDNGEKTDEYYSLIRPPKEYDGMEQNGLAQYRKHHIKEDMLTDERTFDELWPEVKAFIDGLPLVAHNASCERGVLTALSQHYGIDLEELLTLGITDTLTMAKRIEPDGGGKGFFTLESIVERYGLPEQTAHHAKDDAEMCGNLYLKLLNVAEEKVIEFSAPMERTKGKRSAAVTVLAEDREQRTDLDAVAENPFKERKVLLSNMDTTLKQEWNHQLHELGAIVMDKWKNDIDILITGKQNERKGKVEKALGMGIQVIGIDDFREMLKQCAANETEEKDGSNTEDDDDIFDNPWIGNSVLTEADKEDPATLLWKGLL